MNKKRNFVVEKEAVRTLASSPSADIVGGDGAGDATGTAQEARATGTLLLVL